MHPTCPLLRPISIFQSTFHTLLVYDANTRNLDSWHHYAITHCSSTSRMNVYVDGVLAYNQTDSLYATPNSASPSNFRIGYSPAVAYPSLTYFYGYLDDLALFRGVLSIGQIRQVPSLFEELLNAHSRFQGNFWKLEFISRIWFASSFL